LPRRCRRGAIRHHRAPRTARPDFPPRTEAPAPPTPALAHEKVDRPHFLAEDVPVPGLGVDRPFGTILVGRRRSGSSYSVAARWRGCWRVGIGDGASRAGSCLE
jgi:hypothetical protein